MTINPLLNNPAVSLWRLFCMIWVKFAERARIKLIRKRWTDITNNCIGPNPKHLIDAKAVLLMSCRIHPVWRWMSSEEYLPD